MADYSHNLVKQYKHWGVYVHDNQGFLGRCVIWCDRDNALDLSEATKEEREELFVILGHLKQASHDLFQSDWVNYSFLGNETPHLHGHFLPRYQSSRTFMNMEFFDHFWGKNYQTDHSFATPSEILTAIRDEYRQVLLFK